MSSELSARQYAALFDAAPVALLAFDRDLVMVHANPAYLAATEKRLDEIVGRYVFDVFPNSPTREEYDQAASLEGVMRAAVDTGEPQVLAGYRYAIPLADGGFEVRHWNVNEVPVPGDDGEPRLVLHYTEDVTDLVREREAREAAARANEQLQSRVAAAQADLRRRADELEVLNERLQLASAHDRSVAEALQQAMLTTLPDRPPLRLAANYRAAAQGDRVGGDWYDAITLPDGNTSVVIGDVVGHDIGAAALMGQLRSMMRAFAWATEEPPSVIMSQLDRAMRDLELRTYATAVLARFDQPAAGAETGDYTMRWTNAGHPAPVVVRPDGTARVLDDEPPAVLLGVRPDSPRPDHEIDIEPGTAVYFYTDGLVESRDTDLLLRIEQLRQAAVEHRGLEPATRVQRIIDDMVGPHPDDDVALLVVELAISPVPADTVMRA